jgi:hypothetical protein
MQLHPYQKSNSGQAFSTLVIGLELVQFDSQLSNKFLISSI